VLVVDKRDDIGQVTGSRVCVDLKALNKVMLPDIYPLPSLSEVLAKAVRRRGPDSYRFKLEGTQSYHRFAMKQKIVCFKWRGKMYVGLRAFFGGKTMPACFQRVIDAIIRELGMGEELSAYLDDIMGSYPSKEENIVMAVILMYGF
jgi:hypothetical protein